MDLETISIKEIFRIVKKRLKIIIIIPLITTILAIIYSFYIVIPKYEAYTKVFIGKEIGDQEKYNNNDVEMYQKLLKTYSEVIKTNNLVTKALKEHNINLKSEAVLSALTALPRQDTQIIEIRYESSDKLLAGNVVSAITDEFVEISQDLISNGTVKIIEDVIIPPKPTNINKKLNTAIGLMLGFIISFSIIFLLELLDNTFKTKEKLERIMDAPTIGVIPSDAKILRKGESSSLIVEQKPKSIFAEAYRTIKTNIEYSLSEKQIQTILITSANLQEGKSTVAANLGLTFAENEKTVIIVDCDFRNPSLHQKFNLHNDHGLSDIIIDKKSVEIVIQKYNENLYILSSGNLTEKPASTLSSKAMNDVLIALKKKYDVIILDSAPIKAVTDAQILSTKVDGTLIVVRAGITHIESALEAKNLINKVGGTLIGTVLNGVEISKDNYYYNNNTIEKNSCDSRKNLTRYH